MVRSLSKWIRGWLHGGPHCVVGPANNPYLHRWYILPRNPILNVYLHRFLRDDDDRALHDHPWPSLSILLRGRYLEEMDDCDLFGERRRIKRLRSWQWRCLFGLPIVFRWATHTHRVELPDGKPAWTLFITGPRVREWGFHCDEGRRWVHWKEFTAPGSHGETGKGCEL